MYVKLIIILLVILDRSLTMATKWGLSLVLLLVLATTMETEAFPWGIKKMSVRIINTLPGVLEVHCFTRTKDLGDQFLQPGAEYYFNFRTNFWGSNKYYCRFVNGPHLYNQFAVWLGPGFLYIKHMDCEQCVWKVAFNGFYRAQEGKDFELVRPWLTY